MPTSLRGRLLLSYFAVILTTLLVVAAALVGFATVTSARYLPILQRLADLSRANQRDLLDLWSIGAGPADLQLFLEETADLTGVRIFVVDAVAEEVVLDTAAGDDWTGDSFSSIERPRLVIPNIDRGSIFGRFRHPDGANWLVYAAPNPALGQTLIFYALPEPPPSQFFREYFLRPLVVAGLLALSLAILLAALIARSVARPLQKMATAAGGIARGDYEQQIPLQGPEEIRQVAGSFNTMAAQVKATQQAQRDFVANVSHDLKTPITAISGWSQALLDGAAATPTEQTRAAETIHAEAGRMQRMVNDLLDLARLESGQLSLIETPVDLAQVMDGVQRNFQRRAEDENVRLTLHRDPAPPVYGDADRLAQVFTNLVDNALTYTPAGGEVRLMVRPAAEAGWVEGVVADTGPGIPAEELPRIFERFYQVEKSRSRENGRGSGLGLAIVRELVEAHGGSVRISSATGRGATFVVSLPEGDAGQTI